MNSRHASIWQAGISRPSLPALATDLRADVCVVGGGIAGCSAAYELARAGRRVVLLEGRRVGSGDTGVTTAHLSSALDDRYQHLESLHGPDGARLAYESHQSAIERIEEIAREEAIDCDLVRLDGYLALAPGGEPELLERELAAAHRAGYADVERLPSVPGVPAFGSCLRFPRQGRFHPLRYVDGLVAAIRRRGGEVYEQTHVEALESERPLRVLTAGGAAVEAEAVVVATNSPVSDRLVVHGKQEPYLTFAVALPIASELPDALWWDTADPYHYVRRQILEADGERRPMLVVGGEDTHTGHPVDSDERFTRLGAWARERFPVGEVELRWSGQVMEPADALAFIGRDPGRGGDVYVATGDSGHGMTHGAIAGLLLRDLVLGAENPWERLYDPSRVTLRAAGSYAHAAKHVAEHYAEWLTGGEQQVASVEDVPAGGGRIVRRAGRPVAVYRDESGRLHELSAVCRHLGCIVHWNELDRTWDCPCDGSRYAATGEVVHGPAKQSLPRVGGG